MYSYGSSARAGVGKRGHGGRPYRPPKNNKRDPNATPPPLKKCSCLIELEVQEYQNLPNSTTTTNNNNSTNRRLHFSFAGHDIQAMERYMRSHFLVHLVIPGRRQTGPIGIVGKSLQEALPATAWLLSKLQIWPTTTTTTTNYNTNNNSNNDTTTPATITGRIRRNVQNLNDLVIIGQFCRIVEQNNNNNDNGHFENLDNNTSNCFWLFHATNLDWHVLTCPITLNWANMENDNNDDDHHQQQQQQQQPSTPNNNDTSTRNNNSNNMQQQQHHDDDDTNNANNSSTLTRNNRMHILQTCWENLQFHQGSSNNDNNNNDTTLFVFMDPSWTMTMAIGNQAQTTLLQEEIQQAFSLSPTEN